MTLPFWILLAAGAARSLVGQTHSSARFLARALLVVLVADALGSDLQYYLNHGNRLDWRWATGLVAERREPEDVVVTTRPLLAGYYLGQDALDLTDLDLDEQARWAELAGSRIWFLIDSEGAGSTSLEKLRWVEERSELVDFTYIRVREKMILRIYLFEPTDDGSSATGPPFATSQ
jgi:hypothetical protein